MGLKGVCCQQRARVKGKRQLASKATSPGLLLMRLPQTMTTRKMCSRIMSCLMTVTWRTDAVSLSSYTKGIRLVPMVILMKQYTACVETRTACVSLSVTPGDNCLQYVQ